MTASRVRGIGALHLATGAALVVAPARVARLVPDRRCVRVSVVRVLGLRYAAQGALELLSPTGDVALAGAATDLLHAASMGPAAMRWPQHRNAATLSALAAGASALALLSAIGRRR